MQFSFTHPFYLFLILIIPLLIFIHFFLLRKKIARALRFANFAAISKIRGIDFYSKNFVVLALSLIIALFLILAVSGFTIRFTTTSSSFSFVLAIDASTSMEADDIYPTRIAAAKETAINFVKSTPIGTRLGVVSFSGNAFIEQELTDDKSQVINNIREITLSGLGGTDLAEAIVTSTNSFRDESGKSIILFSDGQINVGSLDKAVDYANKNNVIVHTIALGTKEGGMTGFGISKLDEDSLKSVAYHTEGKFFLIENREFLVSSLKDIIDLKIKKISINLSRYLLLISIFLFLVLYVLINSKYKVMP